MHKKLFVSCLLLLSLTSCNDALTIAVSGNKYVSADWNENYYTERSSSLINSSKRNTYNLSSYDMMFTSFDDEKFKMIDPDGSKRNLLLETGENSYSNYAKLSNFNESVKDGVASKMFDGIMSCGGRYEKVRTQINNQGFAYKFNKTMKNNTYFAMHFKSDNNYKVDSIPAHQTSFDLYVDLYYENNQNYSYDRYIYSYDNFMSNSNIYSFFGFSIKDCKNLIGFGISYSNLIDEYKDKYAHALLIYEVLFPYSIW